MSKALAHLLSEQKVNSSMMCGILDELDQLGWTFNYTTMKDGVRGHYATVGYLRSPFASKYEHVEVDGVDFETATTLAIIEALHKANIPLKPEVV